MLKKPRIYRFEQVDSTNSVAFRYAREGASSGSVFVADYQTNGRGKWGRRWISPKGENLLFSLLLITPKVKASYAPWVTQIACRSVAKILQRRFNLRPTFKRPNDIMIKGRKICGVLVETQGKSSGHIESLVVGVGLNVNSSPPDLGATSLAEETGKKQSKSTLFKALVDQLRKDLAGL